MGWGLLGPAGKPIDNKAMLCGNVSRDQYALHPTFQGDSMTLRSIAALTVSLCSLPLFAEDPTWGNITGNPPFHRNPDRSLLRVNATLTPDVGKSDEPGIGFELAAGIPIPPLDTLAVFVGQMEADDTDLTTIGLFAEETYKLGLPIMPYVSAGLGYAWLDSEDKQKDSSIIAEVEAGLKFQPCPYATIHAGVEYDWADEDIFPTVDGLEEKQIRFVAGLTWLY
jgi:hypothetical protein